MGSAVATNLSYALFDTKQAEDASPTTQFLEGQVVIFGTTDTDFKLGSGASDLFAGIITQGGYTGDQVTAATKNARIPVLSGSGAIARGDRVLLHSDGQTFVSATLGTAFGTWKYSPGKALTIASGTGKAFVLDVDPQWILI